MPKRILIVDSDIPHILRLKKALEDLSFEVRAVGRPRPALIALAEIPFDVALVDLYLERTDVASFVQQMRSIQPNLPLVISGRYAEDPDKLPPLDAQGYIHKPYLARNLVPVLEKAVERGYELPDSPPSFNKQELLQPSGGFDALLEMALTRAAKSDALPDEKATIGDVLGPLHNPDVEAAVRIQIEADEDAASAILVQPQSLAELLESAEITAEDTNQLLATSALRVSSGDAAIDDLMHKIERWSYETGHPPLRLLPSWQAGMAEVPRSDVPPAMLPESGDSLTMALDAETASTATTSQLKITALPEFPVQDPIDERLLAALAEADNLDDPQLQSMLSEAAAQSEIIFQRSKITEDDEGELILVSVDEITRAMGAVLSPETQLQTPESAAPLQQAAETPLTEESLEQYRRRLIARAALRLTEVSLESTALGTLLTQEQERIAQSGDLPDFAWQEIVGEIILAWQREGNPRTRVLYREITPIGETLLFSTRSIDGLTLTMIFSADTPLRIIRKQAARLTGALLTVPEPAPETIAPPPAAEPFETPRAAPAEEIIPEAARTTPSRPTDLLPPPELREAIAPTETTEPVAAPPPARETGTYVEYACLWLLESQSFDLSNDLAALLTDWIHEIAGENNWDVIDLEIAKHWVNLYISIPKETLPSMVIQKLMKETSRRMQNLLVDAIDNYEFIWADSYSVSIAGHLLPPSDVERFIKFYDQQRTL